MPLKEISSILLSQHIYKQEVYKKYEISPTKRSILKTVNKYVMNRVKYEKNITRELKKSKLCREH